jgi:hypothetical protein
MLINFQEGKIKQQNQKKQFYGIAQNNKKSR